MKAKLKHNDTFDYIVYNGENIDEVIDFFETDKKYNKTYNTKIIHKDFYVPESYTEIRVVFTARYMIGEVGQLLIVPNEYVVKLNNDLTTFTNNNRHKINFIVLNKEDFDSLFDKELTA